MTTTKRKFEEVDVEEDEFGGSGGAARSYRRAEADIEDSSEEEVERDETPRSGEDNSNSNSDSDSDGDGDGEEFNERWGSASPEQDVRVEAFSMAQELRRGKFNDAGTYVAHACRGAYSDDEEDDDDDDDDDEEVDGEEFYGIETVDNEGMERAREAQVAQAAAVAGDADSETIRTAVDVLCQHVQDGETTEVCLQRLYAGVKRARGQRAQRGRKGQTRATAGPEAVAVAQEAIDSVTDSVAVLERRRLVNDVLATSRAAWTSLLARLSESEPSGPQ